MVFLLGCDCDKWSLPSAVFPALDLAGSTLENGNGCLYSCPASDSAKGTEDSKLFIVFRTSLFSEGFFRGLSALFPRGLWKMDLCSKDKDICSKDKDQVSHQTVSCASLWDLLVPPLVIDSFKFHSGL